MADAMRRDDAQLVEAVRAGTTAAFADLVERHAPAVYRLLRAAVAQPADAEDLAQEVFLDSYRALARLRDPTRFRAHLLTIAARRAADYLRRRSGADRVVALGDDPPARPQTAASGLGGAVDAIVDGLPSEARLILALRHHEGYSCKQIARILEVAEGTVHSRLSRIHAAIRRALPVEDR